MKCDGCIHELLDRTKEPCEPCMASVLNGGERINYEAVPKKTYTVTVVYKDTGYDDYKGVYSHRFTEDWLYIDSGAKYYIRLDDVSLIQIIEE